MPKTMFAAVLACASLVTAGCGGGGAGGDDGPEPDAGIGEDAAVTGCTDSSQCGTGMKCSAGMCVVGGCGEAALNLSYVAPNLLFVVDRSCSMKNAPTGATASKWAIAVGGINQVITDYATDIRWGLTLFPDTAGQSCVQDTFAYQVADNNGASIQSLLTAATSTADALYPDGPCVTNIDTGLQQAATDPALMDPTRASYLMLVTDGAQSSCNVAGGDAGSEAIVKELHDTHGIKTFVLGFGSGVDAAQLDKLAAAGGTALTGTAKYYRAETAGELDAALAAIADQVISCDYVIDPAPPFLAKTYVWFEKTTQVPRDTTHVDGWDFDTTTSTLTFYGGACEQLKTRAVDTVDVVYDCDGPLL